MSTAKDRFKLLSDTYDINFDSLLGKGTYGSVYEATNRNTEKDVAVKVFSGSICSTDALREMDLMSRIPSQPFIAVALDVGVVLREVEDDYFGKRSVLNGAVVMERLDSSLYDKSMKWPSTSDQYIRQVRTLSQELARALLILHCRGISHGDLKPSNVMTYEESGNLHVKLIDFGGAEKLNRPFFRMPYTPLYSPPEVLLAVSNNLGKNLDTVNDSALARDVWSYGATLYYMCTGKDFSKRGEVDLVSLLDKLQTGPPIGWVRERGSDLESRWNESFKKYSTMTPFTDSNLRRILQKDLLEGMHGAHWDAGKGYALPMAVDIIAKCMQFDSNKRLPNALSILQQPFIKPRPKRMIFKGPSPALNYEGLETKYLKPKMIQYMWNNLLPKGEQYYKYQDDIYKVLVVVVGGSICIRSKLRLNSKILMVGLYLANCLMNYPIPGLSGQSPYVEEKDLIEVAEAVGWRLWPPNLLSILEERGCLNIDMDLERFIELQENLKDGIEDGLDPCKLIERMRI